MRTLRPKESQHFFYLHRHLMLYTNERYNLSPEFKSVDDFIEIDEADIGHVVFPLCEKMYQSENIDKFSRENPYDLSEKDLGLISRWKYTIKGEAWIVRHLSEYSVFLMSNGGKTHLYGVKSLSEDLEHIIPKNYLPEVVIVTLLPYGEHIIYDGYMQGYNIAFGSGMKSGLREEYNQAKMLHGIYSEYKIGDDLANPPPSSTLKDQVEYYIKESLSQGEYPHKALAYAKQHNQRDVFERAYTKHFAKDVKRMIKENDEIPPMFYAMYRECVIAVMRSKKELMGFCEKNYPDIIEYLTVIKGS